MKTSFDQNGNGNSMGGSREEEEFISSIWPTSFEAKEPAPEVADDPEVTQASTQASDFKEREFPGKTAEDSVGGEYDPWAKVFADGGPAAAYRASQANASTND